MKSSISTKKWLLSLCFAFIGMVGYAQQQGQYSQYMLNYFLINPAAGGTDDYIDVRAGYRMQWTGLSGAPRNYYVSANMPLGKIHSKMSRGKFSTPHHAIGAIVNGQTLGILSHNTAYLTYAYHLPITSKAMLSFGAMGGINQMAANQSKADWGDNVYDASVTGIKKTSFDMGVGIWFYTKKFFAGVSSMQIPQSKLAFSEQQMPTYGVLNRHYYLTGGYKFKVNQDVTFIPSLLFKNTTGANQVDVNAKIRYQNRFWAGMSYRRTDAIVFLAGMVVPLAPVKPKQGGVPMLEIGYSYDATTSKLRGYSYGTHEIMVALLLPTKGRMICPSDFW